MGERGRLGRRWQGGGAAIRRPAGAGGPRRSAGPPRSRAWRRRGVVAAYGGYAAVVGAFWLKANTDLPGWPAVLPLLAGLVMVAGLSTVFPGSGGGRDLANETDAALDERERQVRDRAYRLAYVGVAAAFMLLVTYAALVADSGVGRLPRSWNELQAIMWGVLILTWTLPSAVVAWTEPDPIEDETVHPPG